MLCLLASSWVHAHEQECLLARATILLGPGNVTSEQQQLTVSWHVARMFVDVDCVLRV